MTLLDYCCRLCNLVASSYHPDRGTAAVALMSLGADGSEELPTDGTWRPTEAVYRAVAGLVAGYVETSRSEGGYSAGIDAGRVERNLRRCCKEWGIDAGEYLGGRTLADGSGRW